MNLRYCLRHPDQIFAWVGYWAWERNSRSRTSGDLRAVPSRS